MRTFIAVAPPARLKSLIVRTLEGDRTPGGLPGTKAPRLEGIKWVEEQNLHFTLRFLGETRDEQVEELKLELAMVGEKIAPFDLELAGPGVFPSPARPRVLWLGSEKGGRELSTLAAAVEQACRDLGWPPETKPFKSHLTVGRVRDRGPQPRVSPWLDALADFRAGSFPVTEFILYKSTLTPNGPVYQALARFPLQG